MPRVTITVPERNPQPYRFQLDRQKVHLGRGSDNDIVVDCASVSVRHAVMERVEGGYQLRDLGSTNGIKLEGMPREMIPLRHGLSVKIGDVAFDFTLTDEEREALGREKPQEESPIIREDELEAPAARKAAPKPAAPRPLASAQQPSTAASFFMTLLFLLLAAGAFFVGLSIRHQKETGNSLIQDMKGKGAAAAPAAEGAKPAPQVAPAE